MCPNTSCRIYVGTSGFSYDDWQGIVYPAGPGIDRLSYIGRFTDALEINTSFYRPVTARMVQSWLTRTMQFSQFLFCFKLHRRFTHERSQRYSSSEMQVYLDGLDPATQAGRLGAILAQFPFSMRYSQESVDWLMRLAEDLADYPLAVEVRHSSWDNDRFYQFLLEHQIAFCNIDQPALANCIEPKAITTAPFAYVRLHGRNAANWFGSNISPAQKYNYLYSQEELEQWVQRIGQMQSRTKRIFVFANNHFVGRAAANAVQLRHMFLGEKLSNVPPILVENFPQLEQICTAQEQDGSDARSNQQTNNHKGDFEQEKLFDL